LSINSNSTVRRITPEDADFLIISGYAYYPRAAINIESSCPSDVQKIVQLAISNNWITAEAWVRGSEYMWEKLSDNAS
jgi:hypothetical protein